MKERPILFNALMVKAILEGRKTQTRRIVNEKTLRNIDLGHQLGECYSIEDKRSKGCTYIKSFCPYGQVGDRLWVRETWSTVNLYGEIALAYKADGEVIRVVENESFQDEDGLINYDDPRLEKYSFAAWADDLLEGKEGWWKPSIHMPRWASRILLEITNIRVERLNDISVEDALAEGITHKTMNCPRHEYFQLWNNIYGEMAHELNPWVWVVEFRVVKGE